MSGSSPALFGQASPPNELPESQEMDTRFGHITIRPRQAIHFPAGLLGMPDKLRFCLATAPSERMARFSILQSLDDPSLAFMTLPLDVENPIIEPEDIAQASHDLGLPLEDALLLLLVSVHREAHGTTISVNARAPILVRVSLRLAVQYVFPHAKYLIRQPLSL